MERLNRNISSMNEKHAQVDAKLAENEVKTKDIETAVDESKSKLEVSGDAGRHFTLPTEAECETKSVEEVQENSSELQSRPSSEEMMKKISEDVDLSNQKVLQTIEFLSQNSSGQDSPASPREEEEELAEVPAEEPLVGTRDSIKAWLSLSTQPSSWNTEQVEEEPEKPTETSDFQTEVNQTTAAEVDVQLEAGNQSVEKDSQPESCKDSILQWLSLSRQPKDWLEEDKCLSKQLTAAEFVDKLEQLEELKMNEKKEETTDGPETGKETPTKDDMEITTHECSAEVQDINKVEEQSFQVEDTTNQEELLVDPTEVQKESVDGDDQGNSQEEEMVAETLEEDYIDKLESKIQKCSAEECYLKVEDRTNQEELLVETTEVKEEPVDVDYQGNNSLAGLDTANEEREILSEILEEDYTDKTSVQENEEDEDDMDRKVEDTTTSHQDDMFVEKDQEESRNGDEMHHQSSSPVQQYETLDETLEEAEEPKMRDDIESSSIVEQDMMVDAQDIQEENKDNEKESSTVLDTTNQVIVKEESEEPKDLFNIAKSSVKEEEEDKGSLKVENQEETLDECEEPINKADSSSVQDTNVEPENMDDINIMVDTMEEHMESVNMDDNITILTVQDDEKETLEDVLVEEDEEPKLIDKSYLDVESSDSKTDCSNSGKKNLDRTFSSEVDECRRNIEHIQDDFFSQSLPDKSETDNDSQVVCKKTTQNNFEPEETHSEQSSNSSIVDKSETELEEASSAALEMGTAEGGHHQEDLKDEERMETVAMGMMDRDTRQEMLEDEKVEVEVQEIDKTVNENEIVEEENTNNLEGIGISDRKDSSENINDNDEEPPSLIDTQSVVVNKYKNESNTLINNTNEKIESEKDKISRASDSRMSIKKRKQRDSMRKAHEDKEFKDSNLTEESKRKSKSIEVFDFYVNSIDDEGCSNRQIEKINLENMKINPDTVEKNDIADILNSAPIDTNAHDDGK